MDQPRKQTRNRLVALAFASVLLLVIYGPLAHLFTGIDRFIYDQFAARLSANALDDAVIISIDPRRSQTEKILDLYGEIIEVAVVDPAGNVLVPNLVCRGGECLPPCAIQCLVYEPVCGSDGFFAVDLRVGTVIAADPFAKARKPAYRLRVDFGPVVGVLQTSAQVTNYAIDALIDGVELPAGVALTVASQHFGPRLLSNFMRDKAAQLVLGTFIGTFAYCLAVLRTVRGESDQISAFVPHLAVTGALALALMSVAMLIYYVHHVSASMQVSEITSSVATDLERSIERLYPERIGEDLGPGRGAPPLI